MEIIKILGVGLISLVFIIILKQYKPEFTIYVSLIARWDYSFFSNGQTSWNNYTFNQFSK